MANPFKGIVGFFIRLLSHYSVKQEDVVGLDITPNCIRIAQLSENKDGWVLEKISSGQVGAPSSIHEIEAQRALYVEKLREMVTRAKLHTTNVAISIPISSAIIRNITLPLMSDEEIQSAIEFDSLWGNIIQLADKLQDYSIFWQVIRRNTAENTMELLFVASKLSEINQYVQIATRAGLNPVVVDVRCFASRNALKTQQLRTDKTTALIEFGPNENYVLIVTNDSPFIYDIYISESDRALIETGIPAGDAGLRLYNRFSDQVRQAFRSYESKVGVALIEKVWLVSLIPDVSELFIQLRQCLDGYQIALFDPMGNIQIPKNLVQQVEQEPNLSVFSAAIGLATRKVDIFGYYKYVTGVNNVNLLPNRDVARTEEKKKVVSKLGIVAACISTLVLVVGIAYHQYSVMDEMQDQARQVAQLEDLIKQKELDIANINQQKNRYSQMLIASGSFKPNQRFTYKLLEALNRAVPGGVWFNEIIWDSPSTLIVKGDAANDQVIVDFVDRLQKLPMIDRASLQRMNVRAPSTGKGQVGFKQFEVKCVVKEVIDKPASGKQEKSGTQSEKVVLIESTKQS